MTTETTTNPPERRKKNRKRQTTTKEDETKAVVEDAKEEAAGCDDAESIRVLESMLRSNPRFLVAHHIDSYDAFVSDIVSVVRSFGRTQKKDQDLCRIEAYVGGRDGSAIRLEWNRNVAPQIADLRLKNHSYTRNIYADVLFVATDMATGRVEEYVRESVRIGILPVMVGSELCVTRGLSLAERRAVGECPFDLGGYFIVDGKEKVIVSQERGVLNRLFVERDDDPEAKFSINAFARCVSTERKMAPKTVYMRVIASGPRKDAIVIDIPGVKDVDKIPLFVVFRALGLESDADILDAIAPDSARDASSMREFLRPSVVDANVIYTREEAVRFLKGHVKFGTEESLYMTLLRDFLPQTKKGSFKDKATVLGQYCRRLIKVALGLALPTDRDSFLHKRISTSGYMINELFLKYYEQFHINLGVAIDNEFNIAVKSSYEFPFLEKFVTSANQAKLFQTRHIDEGMNKSFKGAWGVVENISVPPELGIVQDLSRISYMSFVSHMRRVAAPLDDKAKVTGPHKLNGTQWGLMCPCESPDGRNVGLLKNIALLARVTRGGMPTSTLIEALHSSVAAEPVDRGGCGLYANNVFVFTCADRLHEVVDKLVRFRDAGAFGPDAAVSFDAADGEVHVRTDDGRVCRPLWSLVSSPTRPTQLPRSGEEEEDDEEEEEPPKKEEKEKETKKIVYLDVEEINSSALVAMDMSQASRPPPPSSSDPRARKHVVEYTHCEIHPCGILSVYTATIPFANHNQCVRNSFSSAQGKQAIGIYATNFRDRIDTSALTLSYPQRPVVETKIAKMLPASGLLNSGENLIVAIACYSGYNMEDSVILNRASVDRGMFHVSAFKTLYGDEESSESENASTRIVIGRPDDENEKLDERGLPRQNVHIGAGEAAISRLRYVDSYAERKTGDFLQTTSSSADDGTNKDVHEKREMPVKADRNHEGFVDRIYATAEGARTFCKVRLRQLRAPELGDKMASRHGQKGVVGAILAPEDMPCCAGSGVVPDMIINPHAFPSRMTVGHVLECLAAKAAVLRGSPGYDATPFQDYQTAPEFRMSAAEQLAELGFDRYGNEVMHSGMTGQQMAVDVFVGPTYYYRLKHMVADKINSRATGGRIVGLTGQPTKGRANDGGMRVGEMERDAILAHGMSSFLKETFCERSDGGKPTNPKGRRAFFSVQDGDFTYENADGGVVGSAAAASSTQHRVDRLNCPEAFKLLTQELKAFHIDTKLSSASTSSA